MFLVDLLLTEEEIVCNKPLCYYTVWTYVSDFIEDLGIIGLDGGRE